MNHQYVVVVTENWDGVQGKLYCFEEGRRVALPYEVVVGAKGMGWGIGEHSEQYPEGPTKKEGDGKAPAGIFTLGSAFGYGPESPLAGLKLPYIAIDESLFCVDDPASVFYNCIVRKGDSCDWKSAEEMTHPLYRFGLVVHHNTEVPRPYCGSCIFMHIWRSAERGTAGCTAMAEENLKELILWLDPAKQPLLVQLPLPVYLELQEKWKLPLLRPLANAQSEIEHDGQAEQAQKASGKKGVGFDEPIGEKAIQ